MKPKSVYKLGELFCGPGGIGVGASRASVTRGGKKAKISHAWATDYDSDSCETFKKNLNLDDSSVFCQDVREANFSRFGSVDGLSFGFPCNDFSIVGEQKGVDGNFGPLYLECVRAVNECDPQWFVAENVGGLSSSNDGRAFSQILEALADAGRGYELVPHLYEFEKYGVPQRRHRIIIVGIRSDLGKKFKVPAPTHSAENFVSVKDVLETDPPPSAFPNSEETRQSATVIERLKLIRPGENVWNADLPDHLKLNVKGARLSQIYKRLEADQPSYTITGSGGGGTHVYHYAEPRALTNRERARIQTFPDEHIFFGQKESVRKQIGMAVPPMGVKQIFEALLKTLHGIPYEETFPNIETSSRFPDANVDQIASEQLKLAI